MLCDTCFRMLRGQDGRVWKGTYDLHYSHHTSGKDLCRSARMNCGICRILLEELQLKLEPSASVKELPVQVRASLSVLDPSVDDLYRLDFKLRSDPIRSQRTFVLRRTSPNDPSFRTPISHSTSSDEVYQLSMKWMSKCSCYTKAPSWYPARLISLEQLKTQDYLDTKRLISTNHQTDIYVKLVETKDWLDDDGHKTPGHHNVRYVTLSHRWGQTVSHQYKLTSENLDTFRDTGIQLNDLPKTFRDAIEFAARLPYVGFIWIDSLCIKQGEDERDDWLEQSASMHKVYSETFLNLSATASSNSDGGLFFSRRPELLLEDEIILNIEGLPGAHKPARKPVQSSTAVALGRQKHMFLHPLERYGFLYVLVFIRYLHALLGDFLERNPKGNGDPQTTSDPNETLDVDTSPRFNVRTKDSSDFGEPNTEGEHKNLRRCTILDTSFWTSRVDRAPVNTRGWVFQERIMAPRVLHFCRDQIAWECGEFDAAEGQPQGMQNFQLTSDGIVEESRLKGLKVDIDGKRLRRIRLKGYNDPDPHLQPQIYALELWRRMVEVYSRTAITNPGDKLIALSGLARWMASKIGTISEPAVYVAGLWKVHLASQLLWRVEPVFREVDGVFEHPFTRPKDYRAPSFSWASIDTERGHGIIYADITDKDLFITVEEVSVTPNREEDEYGILNHAHLILRGKLRKACLYPLEEAEGRFGWRLLGRGEELRKEEHTNVYLDCPARDALPDEHEDSIFGLDKEVYVVPAAKGERTASEESKYLTCLILQLKKGYANGPAFRRIGLTKLSPWADSEALHNFKILEKCESDVDMPHYNDYDPETGMHRILIV